MKDERKINTYDKKHLCKQIQKLLFCLQRENSIEIQIKIMQIFLISRITNDLIWALSVIHMYNGNNH